MQNACPPHTSDRIVAYCGQILERSQNAENTMEAKYRRCDDIAQVHACATNPGSQYYALGKKAQSCD